MSLRLNTLQSLKNKGSVIFDCVWDKHEMHEMYIFKYYTILIPAHGMLRMQIINGLNHFGTAQFNNKWSLQFMILQRGNTASK